MAASIGIFDLLLKLREQILSEVNYYYLRMELLWYLKCHLFSNSSASTKNNHSAIGCQHQGCRAIFFWQKMSDSEQQKEANATYSDEVVAGGNKAKQFFQHQDM